MSSYERLEISSLERRLREIHGDAKECLSHSVRDAFVDLGLILQIEADIGAWQERAVRHPSSVVLENARKELGLAIYAASSGLYTQAYSSLRLFLELGFASVYYSAHEIEWRRWIDGRQDFSFSTALDEECGLLSPNFVREFYPRAAADAPPFGLDAMRVYRNCSQFLYGNAAATSKEPRYISYREDTLADWCANAKSAAVCVLYLLYCRYADELLPHDDGRLADTLEHSFSYLKAVRQTLQERAG